MAITLLEIRMEHSIRGRVKPIVYIHVTARQDFVFDFDGFASVEWLMKTFALVSRDKNSQFNIKGLEWDYQEGKEEKEEIPNESMKHLKVRQGRSRFTSKASRPIQR